MGGKIDWLYKLNVIYPNWICSFINITDGPKTTSGILVMLVIVIIKAVWKLTLMHKKKTCTDNNANVQVNLN